jgi:cytochrome c
MEILLRHNFLSVFAFVCLISGSTSYADTIKNPKNLVGHGGPVNAVSVSPDGKSALSGSLDYAVMLWDIKNPQPTNTKRFIRHNGAVSAVQFLPSGDKALSSGDDATVYLWDTKNQKLLHEFKGHTAKVVSLNVSKDSSIAVSASWDGTIRLWDLASKKSLQKIKVHNEPVNTALISANNKIAYSGGYDGKIRAWDAQTGDFIKVLHSHGWPINIMRWLPDQKHIVFGATNGDTQIVDVATGKISKILIPHSKPVLGLAVSEEHGLIATGGNDGVIRVWNIKDWSPIGETRTILGPVWALAFTGDGKSLYYGSLDDEVKYWKVEIDDDEKLWKGHKPRRFQVKTGMKLGELQFARKCSVCHTLKAGDRNRAGPSLHNIFGRKAGTLKGYVYSDGIQKSGVVWNAETIDTLFAKGPQHIVPGSKMPLQMVPNDEKRKALIEYLKLASQ